MGVWSLWGSASPRQSELASSPDSPRKRSECAPISKCPTNGTFSSSPIDPTLLLIHVLFNSFEISFWWTKLQALTEVRDFEGIDALAKSKKSPIGYEPFVQHLVSKSFPKQASAYVPKCDAKVRVDLYVKCGEWRQAGLEAKERGDLAKLQ